MDEWCRGNQDALNRKKTFIYPKKQLESKVSMKGDTFNKQETAMGA